MIARILIVASVVGFFGIMGVLVNFAYPDFTNQQIERTASFGNNVLQKIDEKQNNIGEYSSNLLGSASAKIDAMGTSIAETTIGARNAVVYAVVNTGQSITTTGENISNSIGQAFDGAVNMVAQASSAGIEAVTFGGEVVLAGIDTGYHSTKNAVVALLDFDVPEIKNPIAWPQFASNSVYQNDANKQAEVADLLAGIEPAAGGDDEMKQDPPNDFGFEYDIEDSEIMSEAVLVPRAKTVISSSRDGKIKEVHFKNGDLFKKGDVLLEYHCDDVTAELNAVEAERRFAGEKHLTTSRLFNMDLSSTLEVKQTEVEKKMALAKKKTIEMRANDCEIRAGYDGRVVKRMVNDNEYTRTDRVLMEVATIGTLDTEFLLPSKSLRWVNVDAPITLIINETGKEYTGAIKQIYGEVDPVSQSIQIRAGLDDYAEPLLPGMSGQVTVDVRNIREAGIAGFLETKTQ